MKYRTKLVSPSCTLTWQLKAPLPAPVFRKVSLPEQQRALPEPFLSFCPLPNCRNTALWPPSFPHKLFPQRRSQQDFPKCPTKGNNHTNDGAFARLDSGPSLTRTEVHCVTLHENMRWEKNTDWENAMLSKESLEARQA